MVLGTLIHSRNKLADIYGYLILMYLIIGEKCLARNLKNTVKKRHEDSRGKTIADAMKTEYDEEVESSGGNQKFLIKVKDNFVDSSIVLGSQVNNRSSLMNYEESPSIKLTYLSVDMYKPYEYDSGFLANRIKDTSVRAAISQTIEDVVIKSNPDSEDENQDQQRVSNYQEQNNQIGKLLYYFTNRDIYLNCKMYYGAIYVMFRMTFFILISVSDIIDCIISLVALLYLCHYWQYSIKSPMQSVRSVNKLAVIIVSIKYLIGCLDIQRSNYSGDTVDSFQSSVVLIFLGSTQNKYYYYFDILIGKSLQKYWLMYECMIFIAIQLLIYFYVVILMMNTDYISSHINKMNYMIKTYIHYNLSVMTSTPFYINFSKWHSPKLKFAEKFLKMGTINLPIISILILLGFSQFYSTLPIVAIACLSLFIIYKLIFSWLYSLLEQQQLIMKYFSWIKVLIWIYLILGSISRIFAKPIKEIIPSYNPLGNITLVIVICLISFQVIIDLWGSSDFKRFYKEFLNSNKLSKITIPLCEAYEFNEDKLAKMIANLKSKESLDSRIKIMEKQLKIWHQKFQVNENDKNIRHESAEVIQQWEREIADLDKEEENIVLEMRTEEFLMSKVSLLEKVTNYLYIRFLKQLNKFNMLPHLYLMHYIKVKNSEVCKDIELKIYDYISEEYEEYIAIASNVVEFYQNKDEVKKQIEEVKQKEDHEIAIKRKNQKIEEKEGIKDKDSESIAKATDILFKKVQAPKNNNILDLTKGHDVKQMLYFDSKVKDITIRYYNIVEMASTDLEICHRLSNFKKLLHVLYSMPAFILANFQGITLGVILIYCLLSPNPLKLILLCHIIISGLTEEQNVSRQFWMRTFFIISGIILTKITLKSLFNIQSNESDNATYSLFVSNQTINSLIEFTCGTLVYESTEVLAFLFTIIRILQAQFDGCFEKYINEFENISEAYMRVEVSNIA